ncbi:MAG: DUF5989 family protein [Sedimentisphaerales bacterium]
MAESQEKSKEFSNLAGQRRPSIFSEIWMFLNHSKKWWLIPILLILLLIGLSAAAPFIYTLF